jgi:hypothetical protein
MKNLVTKKLISGNVFLYQAWEPEKDHPIGERIEVKGVRYALITSRIFPSEQGVWYEAQCLILKEYPQLKESKRIIYYHGEIIAADS